MTEHYDSDMDTSNAIRINDWSNQLAVLKAQYCDNTTTANVAVYYLDDENDEVKICDQTDYDYASQMAHWSSGTLNLIIRDENNNKIIAKPNLIFQNESKNETKKQQKYSTTSTDPIQKIDNSCQHEAQSLTHTASNTTNTAESESMMGGHLTKYLETVN
jgi:hypothetical protein